MHRIIFCSLFFPADGGVSRHNPLYRFSIPSCNPANIRVILQDGPEQQQARFFGVQTPVKPKQ